MGKRAARKFQMFDAGDSKRSRAQKACEKTNPWFDGGWKRQSDEIECYARFDDEEKTSRGIGAIDFSSE
jgi:hypothetical protein